MKESVIMFSLRDHFLVLNILHISPGLFILQDTKNEILKASSLKKNNHWSTIGDPFIEDPHNHLVRDPSSLTKTQTFSSENLRFSLETPTLFIGDPNSLGVSGVTIENQKTIYSRLKIKM